MDCALMELLDTTVARYTWFPACFAIFLVTRRIKCASFSFTASRLHQGHLKAVFCVFCGARGVVRERVPGTGFEPARPKAQPSEDCASTNFATRVGEKCPERDSNPHALTDTWPSTLPVYQFQHLGSAIKRVPMTPFFFVTPLGLEPRTLSLKVRCSNQLS